METRKAFWAFPLLSVLSFCWLTAGCVSIGPQKTSGSRDQQGSGAYQRGIEYFNEGLYKSAVAELRNIPPSHHDYLKSKDFLQKALSRVTDATVHEEAGLELIEQGRLEDAQYQFKKALEIYPKHKKIAIQLKEVESIIRERKKRLSEQYLKDGEKLYNHGSLDEAIETLEKAYALLSENSPVMVYLTSAYNSRALKHYREENLLLAIRDLSRSLEINPQQGTTRDQLSRIQNRKKLLENIK